jgi:hypothetical protein
MREVLVAVGAGAVGAVLGAVVSSPSDGAGRHPPMSEHGLATAIAATLGPRLNGLQREVAALRADLAAARSDVSRTNGDPVSEGRSAQLREFVAPSAADGPGARRAFDRRTRARGSARPRHAGRPCAPASIRPREGAPRMGRATRDPLALALRRRTRCARVVRDPGQGLGGRRRRSGTLVLQRSCPDCRGSE